MAGQVMGRRQAGRVTALRSAWLGDRDTDAGKPRVMPTTDRFCASNAGCRAAHLPLLQEAAGHMDHTLQHQDARMGKSPADAHKQKHRISYDPAIHLPVRILKNNWSTDPYVRLSTAAPSTAANRVETTRKSESPSTDQWINSIWSIHKRDRSRP